MPWIAKKQQDKTTARLYAALKQAFPEVPDDPEQVVYRYNPVSIRVRVVSPKFRGKSDSEREAMVNAAIESLPPEATEDITMLFMLTPQEAKRPTLLQLEFDDPKDSYL